jgi:hypothetical protein
VTALYDINTYNIHFYTLNDDFETVSYEFNETIDYPVVEKEGYTFIGWFEDTLYQVAFNFSLMPSRDVNVYPKFDINSYEVKFMSDQTVISTQSIPYLSDAVAPIHPIKVGHTFKEWSLAFNSVTRDLDIDALFDINTYEVIFRFADVILSTQQVSYLSNAIAPTSPEKVGHTFRGWSKNLQNITEDTLFEAVFDVNLYRLTALSSTGGSQIIQLIPFEARILDYPIVRSGFIFDGYYKDSLFMQTMDETFMPSRNITVYVKWLDQAFKNQLDALESHIFELEALKIPFYYENANYQKFYVPLMSQLEQAKETLAFYTPQYESGSLMPSVFNTYVNNFVQHVDTGLYQIRTVTQVYDALKYRPESLGKGLQYTVNDASMYSSGANRMRIHMDEQLSTVYFLMSRNLLGEYLAAGVFGLGLKTGLYNTLFSEGVYAFKSGNEEVVVFDANGNYKTEQVLTDEVTNLAIGWVGNFFARFSSLSNRRIPTTFTLTLNDHPDVHQRTRFDIVFNFEFISVPLDLFDSNTYYMYEQRQLRSYNLNTYQQKHLNMLQTTSLTSTLQQSQIDMIIQTYRAVEALPVRRLVDDVIRSYKAYINALEELKS